MSRLFCSDNHFIKFNFFTAVHKFCLLFVVTSNLISFSFFFLAITNCCIYLQSFEPARTYTHATHTADLSLRLIHVSPHTRSWVDAIHKPFYPGQRRTHSVVPMQIVAVVHCTVAQTKSGEGENKEGEGLRKGREDGRRLWKVENKVGRDRMRKGREKKWRGGRREWGKSLFLGLIVFSFWFCKW